MHSSAQIATFADVANGVASIVTKTKKGFAVTFLDTDAEQIIETRIFPNADAATTYAENLIHSTDKTISIRIL